MMMMLRSVRLFPSKNWLEFLFPTYFFSPKKNLIIFISSRFSVAFQCDFSTDHEKTCWRSKKKVKKQINEAWMTATFREEILSATINYFYLCLSIKDILTCMLSSIIHVFKLFGLIFLEDVWMGWYWWIEGNLGSKIIFFWS